MWVRDHARKDFHAALGVDIDWYDQEVYCKTSAIARQVFPVELDIGHPCWISGLRRFEAGFVAMDAAQRQGGIGGKLKGLAARVRMLTAFVSLYTIPVITSTPPASVRLEPVY